MAGGISIEATFKGDAAMKRKIKRLEKRYPEAFAAALYAAGFDIMADAVMRVPVDTGRLRGSAFVAKPVKTSRGTVVVLGFGTDYAVFVHERTDVKHTVGEAKFLENALRDKAGDLDRLIRDIILANVERGASVRLPSSQFPTEPRE